MNVKEKSRRRKPKIENELLQVTEPEYPQELDSWEKLNDIDFLKAYQKLLDCYLYLYTVLDPHFVDHHERLKALPSIEELAENLKDSIADYIDSSEAEESPARAKRLKRAATLLDNSDFRIKRAATLLERKKREIENSITRQENSIAKNKAQNERIARLADKTGFDGSKFRNLDHAEDYVLSSLNGERLRQKIQLIPQIIAKLEEPVKPDKPDKSIIPEGCEFLSSSQVARFVGIAESTVYMCNEKGLIPAPCRIGNTVRWPKQEMLEWKDAGTPERSKWELMKRKKS